jgi:hypothetical protein
MNLRALYAILGRLADGPCNAEVNDLWIGFVATDSYEDVRRFDVPVDDPFLVGMLDGLADMQEQSQAFLDSEPVPVAILGDRNALNMLHDEVRPSARGQTRIVDARYMGMLHEGQSLLFGLEASQHALRIHTRLDHFERDLPFDRALLLGQIDNSHASLAEYA